MPRASKAQGPSLFQATTYVGDDFPMRPSGSTAGRKAQSAKIRCDRIYCLPRLFQTKKKVQRTVHPHTSNSTAQGNRGTWRTDSLTLHIAGLSSSMDTTDAGTSHRCLRNTGITTRRIQKTSRFFFLSLDFRDFSADSCLFTSLIRNCCRHLWRRYNRRLLV